jgi:hypothetical protein
MRWDEKKHPRHKDNGRFREKSGSDATAYARRISEKIAESRGEKSPAKQASAKKAPARKAPAKRAGRSNADAPTAAEKRAMARLATSKKTESNGGEYISPKATRDRVEEAKDIVLGMRGASRDEIDAELHPRLKNVTTGRLKAMVEHLNGQRGLYNEVVAKAIQRLIDKRG